MVKEKCRKQQKIGKAGRKTNNSGGNTIKTNSNFYLLCHIIKIMALCLLSFELNLEMPQGADKQAAQVA